MRLSIAIIIFILALSFAPTSHAGVLMKTDGVSINCSSATRQTLKITTGKGIKTVKFADIIWLAGGEKKRIRLSGKTELLVGKVDKKYLAMKSGLQSLSVSTDSIVFYCRGDIDLQKVSTLDIEESNAATSVTTKKKDDKNTGFSVNLLTSNWEGDLKISKPVYDKTLWSDGTLKITYKVEGSINSHKGITVNDSLNSSVFLKASNGTALWTGRLYIDKALLPRVTTKVSLSVPGTRTHQFEGSGNIYLCLTSPDKEETYGGSKLKIQKSVSNVLMLPITIKKSN